MDPRYAQCNVRRVIHKARRAGDKLKKAIDFATTTISTLMDIPCKQSQLDREPNLLMLKNRQSCISQVVKVILTSVRITAAPRPFISIRQVAPMCVPSSNVRFLCFSFYLHLDRFSRVHLRA